MAVRLLGHSVPTKAPAHPSEIFYGQSGFNTLLNAVRAHGNPNENYYFVVNAPPGDKTGVRPAAVYQQYENRPNIHPVVEFNRDAWNKKPGTWAQKGKEFRQEMVSAGLPANTMWAVNEFGHGIRSKSPVARRQMTALTSSLASGGTRGIVFQEGRGTAPGLGNEMKDNKFWGAMKRSVWRYMPETYVSPKKYLRWDPRQQDNFVLGADRRGESGPLMDAFWGTNHGYGNTKVPLPVMQKFVAAQLAQVRAQGQPVYGFAWNDMPAGISPAKVAALANAVVR